MYKRAYAFARRWASSQARGARRPFVAAGVWLVMLPTSLYLSLSLSTSLCQCLCLCLSLSVRAPHQWLSQCTINVSFLAPIAAPAALGLGENF